MLYRMLKKIKETKGFDDAMRGKIDVFYALGKLSDAEYRELLGLPDDKKEDNSDVSEAENKAEDVESEA